MREGGWRGVCKSREREMSWGRLWVDLGFWMNGPQNILQA